MSAPEVKRFVVEATGSLFLTLCFILSKTAPSAHKLLAFPACYASLIFCFSPHISNIEANFNVLASIALLSSGKWTKTSTCIALIGQVLGILIGTIIAEFTDEVSVVTIPRAQIQSQYSSGSENVTLMLKTLIVDFLFSFLFATISTSVCRNETFVFPFVAASCLIAAAYTSSSEFIPNVALNPLLDIVTQRHEFLVLQLYRFLTAIAAATIAGWCVYGILYSERNYHDEIEHARHADNADQDMSLMTSSHDPVHTAIDEALPPLPPSPSMQSRSGELTCCCTCSGVRWNRCVTVPNFCECVRPVSYPWVGVFIEGVGAFYITTVYCIVAATSTTSNSAVIVPLAVGMVSMCLNYCTKGGYFNPALALCVYIQDRNTRFPAMSTATLFMYLAAHMIGAFCAALLCVWLLNFNIGFPKVTRIRAQIRHSYSVSSASSLLTI